MFRRVKEEEVQSSQGLTRERRVAELVPECSRFFQCSARRDCGEGGGEGFIETRLRAVTGAPFGEKAR